jgi:glycosyltransferase involved in cell wall biosynthesis
MPRRCVSRSLKVLFVNPGRGLGGAEHSLLLLLDGLRARGVDVTVALFGDGPLRARLEAVDVPTTTFSVPLRVRRATRYDASGGGLLVGAALGLLSLPAVLALAVLIRRLDVDIVHTNGLKAHLLGGLAGRLARRPVVWHVRDFFPEGTGGQLLEMAARRLPALIITNSNAVATTVTQDGLRPPVPIHNPIDLQRFRPGLDRARLRQELGVGADTPLIGQIAHLTPWKGHETFLRIARSIAQELPAAQFVTVGGAIDETAGHQGYSTTLERQARALRLADRVVFLGERQDIPEILAALDVLVHCPTSPEPFGRVVAEAMAVGTPVVAARSGGSAEIVEEGVTGRLVPADNVGAFAVAVVELVRDPALRRRMGAASRRRAERLFPVGAHVAAVLAAYQSITRSAGSTP